MFWPLLCRRFGFVGERTTVLALCFVGERFVGSRMTFLNYLNPTYILSMTKLGRTILGYKSNNHVAGKFFGRSTRVRIRSSLADQLSY